MSTLARFAAGLLLIAHGLVHLLYLADDVPEFTFDDSWLIPESSQRSIGIAIMWITVAVFGLLGLAIWGVPRLANIWPALAVVASLLSLVLLIAYWSWSLLFGVLINAAIIAVVVLRPGWTDQLHG